MSATTVAHPVSTRSPVVVPFPTQLARRPREVVRAELQAARHQGLGRRYDDAAELVAALLMAIEAAPLQPLAAHPLRPAAPRGSDIAVIVAGQVFRLTPSAARTAGDALFAEQAYPGCIADGARLHEVADLCEPRAPVSPIEAPSPLPAHGRTGVASSLALAALITAAVILSQAPGLG